MFQHKTLLYHGAVMKLIENDRQLQGHTLLRHKRNSMLDRLTFLIAMKKDKQAMSVEMSGLAVDCRDSLLLIVPWRRRPLSSQVKPGTLTCTPTNHPWISRVLFLTSHRTV